MNPLHAIRIGTLVKGQDPQLAQTIKHLAQEGFETFSLTFWQHCAGLDLHQIAQDLMPILEAYNVSISSLSLFGNPLGDQEIDQESREAWRALIDAAPEFRCDLITGFTGRLEDISIPDNMARIKEVFTPWIDRAGDKGLRIAFENCPMGGTWQNGRWNCAFSPACWELLFETLPQGNVGLQWEPCHQLMQFADPMPQLDDWMDKLFNIHGKDASIYADRIQRHGILGPQAYGHHRHPGFGDSDWTAIISRLRAGGYTGSIDIEGWHDPVYKDELEIPGQIAAMTYLKRCRGDAL